MPPAATRPRPGWPGRRPLAAARCGCRRADRLCGMGLEAAQRVGGGDWRGVRRRAAEWADDAERTVLHAGFHQRRTAGCGACVHLQHRSAAWALTYRIALARI